MFVFGLNHIFFIAALFAPLISEVNESPIKIYSFLLVDPIFSKILSKNALLGLSTPKSSDIKTSSKILSRPEFVILPVWAIFEPFVTAYCL